MKIKIKECVGNSRIYREDGSLAGTIEGWPKNGPARKICGADGTVIFQVDKEKGQCVVQTETAECPDKRTIQFQYEDKENENAGSGPSSLFRAPLAVVAEIKLKSGPLTIRQNRKREFTLEDESGKIGQITRIASLNNHEVECGRELDAYEAAMVYVVAGYMYHEDDVDVV